MDRLSGFIEVRSFSERWKRFGLSEDDLADLQDDLSRRPEVGNVIRGTGGLRKVRFASSDSDRGKSGSYRVAYAWYPQYGLVLLVSIYAKNEATDISADERQAIAALLRRQKSALEAGRYW